MGIFGNLYNSVTNSMDKEEISDFLSGADYLGASTSSGIVVDEKKSLQVTTIYACVKIIAWTIAAMPLNVFKSLENGGKEKVDNDVSELLHNNPNPYQTPFEWKALMKTHQLLWGAGISEIEFDRWGKPVALWPIPPWRVEPLYTKSKKIYYRVWLENGGNTILSHDQVVVTKSLGVEPARWLSPIGLHAESVGFDLAVRTFGAQTFGQGTNPAGTITYQGKFPDKMSDDDYRSEIQKAYTGITNSHRIMFLEKGGEFKRIGLPPEDAQFLETRNFSVSDLARIYNVPLHLLQMTEKSTTFGKGLEEINQSFLTYTLLPYVVQDEQEFNKKLIYEKGYYTKYNFSALLRGNTKDRWDSYQKAVLTGIVNVDEVRRLEEMNPLPDGQGEMYLTPLNMTTRELLGMQTDDNEDN